MDEPTNSKFEIKWEIKIGDIVKIMRYDHNAYSVPVYGIVVKKEMTNQIYMFPAVDVLLFESGRTQTFPAGTVEIISSA